MCNPSSNSYFRDIASRAFSRRALVGGGVASAVAIAVGGTQGAPAAQAAEGAAFGLARPSTPNGSPLAFSPIAPVDAEIDEFTVPDGFSWHPIIRWGDRLFSDAPEFSFEKQTAEAQQRQFGYNNDYTEIQEIPKSGGKRVVMFVNHEYTNENIMLPAGTPANQVIDIGMAAHGLTVVELERKNKHDAHSPVIDAPLNRRILLSDAFELTGPAAGAPQLVTKDDPTGRRMLGTLGNCAGGLTTWGTLLSGEENFHGYFLGDASYGSNARYGVTNTKSTARGWENRHDRFDSRIPGYENEPNRFGYVVEVDPWDPIPPQRSTPRSAASSMRART